MPPAELPADDGRVPAYSWYALGVLTLVYMVNFIDRQILSILANDIKADLGLDDAQLGFLYGTAFAIFYALFGIPLGRLADTWSRTRLLALGLALWSSMTVLSGFARSFGTLAVARVGVGIGEATASPCAYSLLADWFPGRLRATALAIYSSGLFVGSGVSLLLGAAVVENWDAAFPGDAPLGLAGWQAAFLLVGLPGLVLAVAVALLREPARPERRAPLRLFLAEVSLILPPFTLLAAARAGRQALLVNLAGAIGFAGCAWMLARLTGGGAQFWLLGAGCYAVFSWASALRRSDPATFALTWGTPAFMQIVLTYGAISVVGYAVTYWAAPYAERAFGLGKVEIGWAIGAPAALAGFLGVIGGGWLADRMQRARATGRLLVLLVGVLAPVPIVLAGYSTGDQRVFLVCAFLVQAATASALGAAAAASQALVLPHMRGAATAIFFLGATLLGLGIGPFAAGYVSEASGSLPTGVMSTLAAAPIGLVLLLGAMRSYGAALASRADRAEAAIRRG